MRDGVNTAKTTWYIYILIEPGIKKRNIEKDLEQTREQNLQKKSHLVHVLARADGENVAVTRSKKSSQQAYEQDLHNWHGCHKKQGEETHLLPFT